MITVQLHGPFRAFHPDPITLAVDTAMEAIEAISRQIEGLKPDPVSGMKRVRVVGFDTDEDFNRPLSDGEVLNLIPAVFLSGGPKTQIIIGTLLIVAGLFMGGVMWPSIIISMGLSMVIGGVMQLLAPQQKLSSEVEEKSKYLGSPPNTVGIGTRIPLLLGEDLVQGHILSSDIDAAETA